MSKADVCKDLRRHLLKYYEIRSGALNSEHFIHVMGSSAFKEFDSLWKSFLAEAANPDAAKDFYQAIADPHLAPLMHSLKAEEIIACGAAISEALTSYRRILDIGCHTGYLTTWYAAIDKTRKVIGIDRSAKAISQAKRLAPADLMVKFNVIDCSQTSLTSLGEIDAVVSSQVFSEIMHMGGDLGRVLDHIKDILIPGGRLVMVSRFNKPELKSFLILLRQRRFEIQVKKNIFFQEPGEDTERCPFLIAIKT